VTEILVETFARPDHDHWWAPVFDQCNSHIEEVMDWQRETHPLETLLLDDCIYVDIDLCKTIWRTYSEAVATYLTMRWSRDTAT
jgi:hypothetical protein